MKYEFIDANRTEHRVSKMCKVLSVSVSGYFAWKRRVPKAREQEELKIIRIMMDIHEKNHMTYGGVKMQRALGGKGFHIGLGRVFRMMRQNGIYTVHRYKHRPKTKEQTESIYQDNVLNREFKVDEPNKVWVRDITYIKAREGWVYLAVVLDLFNKEVVGWSMARNADTELVTRAMAHALVRRNFPERVLFHSDRGCQYSSKRYQKYLTENQIESSMSRKGNPFDNACCESFFATLKKEWVYFKRYADLRGAESSIFEYIEIFYNRKRMHSSLGYLSPKQFLTNYLQEIMAA